MKRIVILLLAALLLGCTPKPIKPGKAAEPMQTEPTQAELPSEHTAEPTQGEPTAPTSDPQKPPTLYARSGGEIKELLRGSYSWTYPNADGTMAGVDACGLHPLEAASHLETLALGGRTLLLGFGTDDPLPDNLQVRVWESRYVGDEASYDRNFLWLPTETVGNEVRVTLPRSMDGVLEARVRWEQKGDCSYALQLAADPQATEPQSVPFTAEALSRYDNIPEDGGVTVRVLRAWPEPGTGDDAEQDLIEVSFLASSGSFFYDVEEVQKDGKETGVILYWLLPEAFTEDVRYWTLRILLPAGTVQNQPLIYWKVLPVEPGL